MLMKFYEKKRRTPKCLKIIKYLPNDHRFAFDIFFYPSVKKLPPIRKFRFFFPTKKKKLFRKYIFFIFFYENHLVMSSTRIVQHQIYTQVHIEKKKPFS